jgi:hypothetical protein
MISRDLRRFLTLAFLRSLISASVSEIIAPARSLGRVVTELTIAGIENPTQSFGYMIIDYAWRDTALRHGSVNDATQPISWERTIQDHKLLTSLYLSLKPWLAIGMDLSPIVGNIPAKIDAAVRRRRPCI